MMHPIDVTPIHEQEHRSPDAPDTPGGWWAILALVLVTALLVTAVIVLGGDAGDTPAQPQPTEAPLEPGA
ncbi:MAG TPA: hypothetical protein VFP42_07640 [Acidimicrobiia bacterium]|nr:hypothetical protein [Acidimicrobiia bacterium]